MPHLHALAANGDPTRTKGLRDQFAKDAIRRFNQLSRDIFTTVVTNDAFGLNIEEVNRDLFSNVAAPQNAFAFGSDAKKVDGFMSWLRDQQDAGVLEALSGPPGVGGQVGSPWASTYIDSAYKQGMKRAQMEMYKGGWDIAEPDDALIDTAFNTPIHADKVALLYGRTYSGLKGITESMDLQISNTLATGLAEGRNPRQLARFMRASIEGTGGDLAIKDSLGRFIPAKRRAETLARTEIIRAHHTGTIQMYRNAGVQGVTIMAEWSTAGDDRVCSECAAMEGVVFSLKEIENSIPLHPNCRCVALPANVGEVRSDAIDEANKKRETLGVEPLEKPEPGKSMFGAKDGSQAGMIDMGLLAGMTKTEMAEMMVREGVKDMGAAGRRVAGRISAIRKMGWGATLDKATDRYVLVPPDGNGIISPKPPPKIKIPPPTVQAPKAKPVDPVAFFPADPYEDVKFVKGLGGSTGAELVEDANGKLWVRKTGNSPDHIKAEMLADEIYRELGVDVPRARLYDPDGTPVKLAEFIEGKELGKLTGAARTAANKKMGKQFGVDALLGNWDVIGANADNVLVDAAGKVWRIDNGGSLMFRAQGAIKDAADWDDFVMELWSMRQNTTYSAQPTFAHLDIVQATSPLMRLTEDMIDRVPFPPGMEGAKDVLKARLFHAKEIGEKALDMTHNQWNMEYTDRLTFHMMGLRKAGVLDDLPKQLIVNSVNDVVDENGVPWDLLRGNQTVSTPGATPVDASLPPYYKAVAEEIQDTPIKDLHDKTVVLAKNWNYHVDNNSLSSLNVAKMEAVKDAMDTADNWILANNHPTPNQEALLFHAYDEARKLLVHWNKKDLIPYVKISALEEFAESSSKFKLPKVVVPKTPKKAKRPRKGAVARWEDYMDGEGVSKRDRAVVSSWQADHGGASTAADAQGYMHFLRVNRKAGDRVKIAHPRKASQAASAWSDQEKDALTAYHALLQEVLGKVDMPGNDRTRRAMLITRTDNSKYVPSSPARVDVVDRQTNNSGAAWKWVRVYGDVSTTQAVPHDMITGMYNVQTAAARTVGGFAGDNEAEFTFIGSLFMKSKVHGSRIYNPIPKTTDATKWDVPLDHLR